MTRPAINPANIRRAQRRQHGAALIILLAGSYLFLSIIVGVIALANQLMRGI